MKLPDSNAISTLGIESNEIVTPKATTNKFSASQVASILDKLKEKHEHDISKSLIDLEIDSLERLQTIVDAIYDRVNLFPINLDLILSRFFI